MSSKTAGEMPFLDHLEELRRRILISLGAVIVGVIFSLWAVRAFNVIEFIEAPIVPYLQEGKLAITSPTEGVMIELRLGVMGGLLLALPILIQQLWGFLSPALSKREKRAILPGVFVGLLLFLLGVWASWTYMVPSGVEFLMNYNKDKFVSLITFDNYWNQVVVFVIALGISMELPLVMTIFAWIGLLNVRTYNKFRRFAIVINVTAGAIIAPDTSPFSALAVAIPLILLYELGVLGAMVVERRRRRAAAATAAVIALLLLGGGPTRLSAQNPPVRQTTSDTGRQAPPPRPGGDSLRLKRLGLPTAPQRQFAPDDSMLKALLSRGAFRVTRFQGDSGNLSAATEEMLLLGRVAVQRDSGTVEAEEMVYRECTMVTRGETQIFEASRQPAVGRDLRLDLCKDRERMVLNDALTVTSELGGDWFLRGNLAVDSSAKRLYMGDGEFTTCALPIPDYHFASREVKWIGQSALVARPAVLYVRDVPVMWLPFLFQDTKPGRRSGILIPQFGLNDIVRPTRSYNRQVTNVGYYYAPSDYFDMTARLDWFANRHLDYSVEARYSVNNRFMTGGIGYLRQNQAGGGSSATFHLDHNQQFNINTRLLASLNYTTNSTIAQGNAIDPFQSVQQIVSSLNLTRTFPWGQVAIGGNRRQTLSDGSGQMTFPTLAISPRQIAIGPNVSWSPSLTLTNATTFKTVLAPLQVFGNGTLDTLKATGGSRNTSVQLNTPFQIGGFNVVAAVSGLDESVTGRVVVSQPIPDPANPGDTLTLLSTRAGDYRSSADWNVGIELWQLFRGSWKLTPTVGITNLVPGSYFLRSAATNGRWVHQKKRFEMSLGAAPTFYGFLNTPVGPIFRMRHEFSPTFRLQYSPSDSLNADFARALSASGGGALQLRAPARLLLSAALTQSLSAKLRPPPDDTTSDDTRWTKVKVFSLSTSNISYDFEQDKERGKTGWVTPTLSNSFQSDLLPGFQLAVTHDLWEGVVGSDTAHFSPYLTNVQASVALRAGTFKSILSLVGLGRRPPEEKAGLVPVPPAPIVPSGLPNRNALGQPTYGGGGTLGSGDFNANLSLSISRTRPNAAPVQQIDPVTGLPILQPTLPLSPSHSSIGLNTSFAPTPFWRVTWSTQYNVTDGRFEAHTIQLQRDLHDWRASFNFLKAPNGNFGMVFSIVLLGFEQDIKFDYQQTTIRPLPLSGVP